MVPIPKGSAEIHRQHSGIVRRRADSGKSGCSADHDSPLHMRLLAGVPSGAPAPPDWKEASLNARAGEKIAPAGAKDRNTANLVGAQCYPPRDFIAIS